MVEFLAYLLAYFSLFAPVVCLYYTYRVERRLNDRLNDKILSIQCDVDNFLDSVDTRKIKRATKKGSR